MLIFKANHDIEQGNQPYTEFENDSIRRKFIQKVYLILTAQIIATMGLVWALISWDIFYEFIQEHPVALYVALVIILVLAIFMSLCNAYRRISPYNYICLILFTLAQTFLVAVICCRFDTKVILMAGGLTALISISLSLYAMQTKCDYTAIGGVLLISIIVLMVLGLLLLFFRTHVMMLIYCSLGVFLYSIFIIYNTQLMMGGKHAYEISPEDYVFAALNLYIDIVQIFLFLLHLLGSDN